MSNKHSATKVESHGLLHDQKIRRITGDVFAHLFLAILAVIWLVPIVWVFAESFNKNTAPYTSSFFPKEWTLDNYRVLFTDRNVLDFPKMFGTTFIIACFTCAISLIFVLSVAYCMSRMRFRVRKTFMNVVLILGMFPGIMAVTAIYFILKALGLSSGTMTTVALILVYSAGSGAGFYVMKGYMDTIPTSLDEAALLDGCTRFQVFHKIIIPICKPMIVYQAIIGFLTPWLDFVMAKVICRTQSNYTVALGLWLMLQKEYIQNWFARFAAAAVVISVPIAILFIVMQRFYQESMSGSVKGCRKGNAIMTLVDNFAQPNTSVAEPFPLCLERPLGAVVAQSGTQFALWAPSAQKVTLRLFSRGSMGESGDALIGQYTMRPESDGSWTYDFADNKHGVYYDFLIERDCGSVDRVADPWARGAGVNGRRSMVVCRTCRLRRRWSGKPMWAISAMIPPAVSPNRIGASTWRSPTTVRLWTGIPTFPRASHISRNLASPRCSSCRFTISVPWTKRPAIATTGGTIRSITTCRKARIPPIRSTGRCASAK